MPMYVHCAEWSNGCVHGCVKQVLVLEWITSRGGGRGESTSDLREPRYSHHPELLTHIITTYQSETISPTSLEAYAGNTK